MVDRARREPRRRGVAAALGLLLGAGLAGCSSSAPQREAPPVVPGFSESGRLVLRGDEAIQRGDYATAEENYREAIDAAVLEPDSSNLTIALAQLAELERLRGRPDVGRAWLADANARATEKEPLAWARFLLVRGRYELEEDPARAEESFVTHFEYCIEHDLPDRALDSAHQLALRGSLGHKVAWSERAIALAEDLGDATWLAVLWNNLGWAYNDAGELAEALDAFQNAHRYHETAGGPAERVAATWAVGRAHRLLGELEAAQEWLSKSLTQAESLHGLVSSAESAQWLGLSLWELAELALDQGRPREAFARLRDAHRTLMESDVEAWWPQGLERLERRLVELSPLADA